MPSPSSSRPRTRRTLVAVLLAAALPVSLPATQLLALSPSSDNAAVVPPALPGSPAPLDVATETPEGEVLLMTAPSVATWEVLEPAAPNGFASVVQLGSVGGDKGGGTGPVSLTIDRTTLSADAAVVWITRAPGTILDSQLVRIALLGNARVEQDNVVREGPNLFVTAVVRGSIRIAAPVRTARDLSAGQTFTVADTLRKVAETPTERLGSAFVARAAGEPETRREVTSEDVRRTPVTFTAGYSPTIQTADGKLAVILSGGVTILQRSPKGDFLQLRSDRAVLLTTVTSLKELDDARNAKEPRDVITGAYLEGDVRITLSPARGNIGEQRLQAERAFYDFTSDRAILTDAILHTVDPQRSLPLVFRAKTVEQISQGQYNAEKVELSTSGFAVPTYSVAASRMYIRQTPATSETRQSRLYFAGDDLTLRAFGVPYFYLPRASGDITNFPLRAISPESSDRFGYGIRTEWGLYESLGLARPRDLDISYRADYLGKRGPATGLDADYRGGLITETTAEPWNFEGSLRSYLIHDTGNDRFAGQRIDFSADERLAQPGRLRGAINFQHQHFLPDDWQVQIRAGYASDSTFLEQYFQNAFDSQLPYELAFYAKRQRDSEQISFLASTSLNNFPTSAELVQEQTFVQRWPELAYRRIGDSVLDDRFTLFSDNTASILSFQNSTVSLQNQGYRPDFGPGFPSFGQTGHDESATGRADLREEINYPVQLGQFKVVPYITGRYTGYTQGPNAVPGTAAPIQSSNLRRIVDTAPGGAQNRVYAGGGTRITTAFWRTDDTVESELFDVHRLRHIVQPVANLYTSATSVDTNELYLYDEQIDKIYDVSAANLRLEQRWETKRGGPGRWRTADLFTFNVEANFFANKPSDELLNPEGSRLNEFRGLWFDNLPETSVPRNSINADGSWHISDTMILLADEEYNLDETKLATASGGLAVQRDPRITYYLEQRYVELLNSSITTFYMSYQVSAKYRISLLQSYDFNRDNNVGTSVSIERRFDRLVAALTIYNDSVNDDTGFRFNIFPEGLAPNRSTGEFFNSFQTARR